MDMTRKKAYTTTYQAFTLKNLKQHWRFSNLPFPAGIATISQRELIDCDEMALVISDANENYGHAVKNLCVCKIGNYCRGELKVTIIMAIEAGNPDLNDDVLGSITYPRIWYHLCTDAVISTVAYINFLDNEVMDKLFEDEP